MKLVTQTILFILVVALYSCDTPACDYSDEIFAKVGFSKFDGITTEDTTFNKMSVYLMNSDAVGFDTLYNEQVLSELELPLSQINDTSWFHLQFDSVTFDVISIFHRGDLVIESHECGFIMFYDLDSITSSNTIIDSVKILRDQVNYADAENIKIYF